MMKCVHWIISSMRSGNVFLSPCFWHKSFKAMRCCNTWHPPTVISTLVLALPVSAWITVDQISESYFSLNNCFTFSSSVPWGRVSLSLFDRKRKLITKLLIVFCSCSSSTLFSMDHFSQSSWTFLQSSYFLLVPWPHSWSIIVSPSQAEVLPSWFE